MKYAFLIIFFLLVSAGIAFAQVEFPSGYFYIIQGEDTICIEPILVPEAVESLWYYYYSASQHTGFEEEYKSKYFFFYNPITGKMGIIFVHNIDNAGCARAWNETYIYDIPTPNILAFSDDPGHGHSHSSGRPCGSTQELDLDCMPQGGWEWYRNTDGGGIYLPRAEWQFKIYCAWGGTDPIKSWWFLSGHSGFTDIKLNTSTIDSFMYGDTLYLGHGFLELLPLAGHNIRIDNIPFGSDTVFEIDVKNSGETVDTLHVYGAVHSNTRFTTVDFTDILPPGKRGYISVNFSPMDTPGVYIDTIFGNTNEPCGSKPIILEIHVIAPDLYAAPTMPLPNTWTSCSDQQLVAEILTEGKKVEKVNIPSNSVTTEFWDTTTGMWLPAVEVSDPDFDTYTLNGTSWIWDSVFTGAIENCSLQFRVIIETPTGATIDSASIVIYADNRATLYMNGDSVGTDDPYWYVPYTFNLEPFMHGGEDTLTIWAWDSGGWSVGIDFMITMFYEIPCTIDIEGIEMAVDTFITRVGDGYLEYVAQGDSILLEFTPIPPDTFEDGDTVLWCINRLLNSCGDSLDTLCWNFYVDLVPPFLRKVRPSPGMDPGDGSGAIFAEIWDLGSGVDTSSIVLTIGSTTIPREDIEITMGDDTWELYYLPEESFVGEGAVLVCIHATDTTDYCPDNILDSCWFVGQPYVSLIHPQENSYSACRDQMIIIEILSAIPLDTTTIELEIDGTVHTIDEEWLYYDNDSCWLYWAPEVGFWQSGNQANVRLLRAENIFGQGFVHGEDSLSGPFSFNFWLDFDPPLMTFDYPPMGADHMTHDVEPKITISIDDPLAGLNPDSVWLLIEGDSVDIPPAELTQGSGSKWNLILQTGRGGIEFGYSDTVTVLVRACDFPDYCAANCTTVVDSFIIEPDIACLVFPNPFTPGNDDINEYAVFNYPHMYTEEAELSIFDVRNREVFQKEIGPIDEISQYVQRNWNGRDKNNQLLPEGLYMYVIKLDGQVICNGTVVLAR